MPNPLTDRGSLTGLGPITLQAGVVCTWSRLVALEPPATQPAELLPDLLPVASLRFRKESANEGPDLVRIPTRYDHHVATMKGTPLVQLLRD